jgi:uncharacterized protein (TIGR03118 family)
MFHLCPINRHSTLVTLAAFGFVCSSALSSPANPSDGTTKAITVFPPGSVYRQTNLVSDIPGFAFIEDTLLVNPWGIAATASSPFWVVNNGTSTTQLFKGDVSGAPLVPNPTPSTITIPGGLPTGAVANTTTDFVITSGAASGPARFIFDSITGNIAGWNPNVPAAGSTQAVIAVSNPSHVYTGLAIGSNAGGNRLYAADFANNHIDVFDGTFTPTTVSGGFVDATVPSNFHVHNIQNLSGSLYVTYAEFDPMTMDVENGVGLGYVRKFNTDGVRDLTFGINGSATTPIVPLDAPWGLTIAPASFGIFGGALLVGNFSDNGIINAFNPTTGAFLGTVQDEAGQPIVNDQLWALRFGNGGNGGDPNTLYFSAGTADEEHGLFGKIRPTTATATNLIQFASDTFSIGEGGGHIDITVTRAGDVSQSATVDYNTYDASQSGHASQKSDYEIALGKLTFNPGETSKTFRILIVDDDFVEGDELINVALSNPTGAGVGLGDPNMATVTIIDNDSSPPTTNPIDDAHFFVRQQYLDFLNGEPDSQAAFLVNQITSCGTDVNCTNARQLSVATAFLLSTEYHEAGFFIYRAYKAAFGRDPLYGEFMGDLQRINNGIDFSQAGWVIQLRANEQAFLADFVTRPQFVANYPTTLTPAQFVDALYANAGVTPDAAERQAAIDEFGGASDTSNLGARSRALGRVLANALFQQNEFNRSFVLLEYFGYWRRDPDTAGFNTRLSQLNGSNDYQASINSFITSEEYRTRFGPAVSPAAPTATPSPTPAQSLNISSRARVQTADNVMIGGFIITGTDPKKVIVRAIGPSLAQSGIFDVLADPVLELRDADGALITSNDNWKDTQQAEIQATGLAPQDDRESAIVATLMPGAYTGIVKGKNNITGVALVEVYDLDQAANSQLGNISTRALVQTQNNVLIGGFILGATTNPATIVVRAIGPSLAQAGISNPLVDPTLELHDANGATIVANDNWQDSQEIELSALGLAPTNYFESALVANLPPAAYTAIVAGKDSGTGVGLVEIYNTR